jgi:hypothetical protein
MNRFRFAALLGCVAVLLAAGVAGACDQVLGVQADCGAVYAQPQAFAYQQQALAVVQPQPVYVQPQQAAVVYQQKALAVAQPLPVKHARVGVVGRLRAGRAVSVQRTVVRGGGAQAVVLPY